MECHALLCLTNWGLHFVYILHIPCSPYNYIIGISMDFNNNYLKSCCDNANCSYYCNEFYITVSNKLSIKGIKLIHCKHISLNNLRL